MTNLTNFIRSTVIAGAFATMTMAAGISSVLAAPFGNATGGVGGFYNPTVTATTIDLSVGTAGLFSGTGEFPSSSVITVSGAFNYSQNVGDLVLDSVIGFLSIADGANGPIFFDLESVLTTAFVGGSSEAISLYLLGSLYEPGAGLTPTAASLTLTLNNNNNGPFTFSATLSDPPAGVPEPISAAILGVGLLGLGLARLRKA